MSSSKSFWIVQMCVLLALYAAALVLYLQGQPTHLLVRFVLLVLAAYLLEIPLAFAMLKGRGAQPLRVIVATQLFGLLWWVPAKRGIFAVN